MSAYEWAAYVALPPQAELGCLSSTGGKFTTLRGWLGMLGGLIVESTINRHRLNKYVEYYYRISLIRLINAYPTFVFMWVSWKVRASDDGIDLDSNKIRDSWILLEHFLPCFG